MPFPFRNFSESSKFSNIFFILRPEFQRITAEQTQGHLSSIWSDAHGSYCSNIEQIGLTWAFSELSLCPYSRFDPTWGSSIWAFSIRGSFIGCALVQLRICCVQLACFQKKLFHICPVYLGWGEVHLPIANHHIQTPSWIVFKCFYTDITVYYPLWFPSWY
jgi:hypothetical protein